MRVLRISQQPPGAVENYRILIDQLPGNPAATTGTVTFVVRQSIPVFFSASGARQHNVRWQVGMRDGRLTLSAQNAGDVALKIASPELSVGGKRFSLSEGLLGYVLGRSSMSWTLSLPSGRRPRPGAAILNYRTETGEVSVPVTISADG